MKLDLSSYRTRPTKLQQTRGGASASPTFTDIRTAHTGTDMQSSRSRLYDKIG